MKNIRHLVSRSNSKTWGEGSWEKVVVCIVADGRKKCDPQVYNYLAAMGVYQEGVAKREVNGKPVEAHVYEVTTGWSCSSDPQNDHTEAVERPADPLTLLFCIPLFNAYFCVHFIIVHHTGDD